ncbi:MAG TPA: Gfo/Idh/MocA family oxidoreductase [Candidatus Acidoferrum sp.]|nr:Gfo/Idh/MocA family oxidoreductase [Candidatus Acidoferrum sp.]
MLQWLVAGVGDVSRKRVLPAILSEPRSKLTGIVTRDPAKADPYDVPSWPDLASALAACDAEAVYIATPVFLHAEQAIAALRAGRHVLCEKPMALDYTASKEMEAAAREAGRTLGVAYYRRMYPKVERARELIAAGAIGWPVFVEATSHDNFNPLGTSRRWLSDPAQSGGGPLRDIASHRIDLFNYFFGEPVRVSAHLSTLVQPLAVEDNATVMIEYAGGVRGVVDVRWHAQPARDEFRIRGTAGEIDLTPLNGPELVYPGGLESHPPHANLHYPCVEDFVSAVVEGRAPRSSGTTALPAEWVMERSVRPLR